MLGLTAQSLFQSIRKSILGNDESSSDDSNGAVKSKKHFRKYSRRSRKSFQNKKSRRRNKNAKQLEQPKKQLEHPKKQQNDRNYDKQCTPSKQCLSSNSASNHIYERDCDSDSEDYYSEGSSGSSTTVPDDNEPRLILPDWCTECIDVNADEDIEFADEDKTEELLWRADLQGRKRLAWEENRLYQQVLQERERKRSSNYIFRKGGLTAKDRKNLKLFKSFVNRPDAIWLESNNRKRKASAISNLNRVDDFIEKKGQHHGVVRVRVKRKGKFIRGSTRVAQLPQYFGVHLCGYGKDYVETLPTKQRELFDRYVFLELKLGSANNLTVYLQYSFVLHTIYSFLP